MSASNVAPPTVYPPMTNSCPRLTRIFSQAPDRSPGSYRLSLRFATSPSRPCALTECTRSLSLASSGGAYRMGSESCGKMCFSISWRRFVSGSPMTSRPGQDQHVEHEEMELRAGHMVLQG